ncbi:ABC transporter ATP-binding protein [Streptomyces flaveus]|uniref:ABC transporter ATP-binding protein n=1 Tax=Streptomyces flaveus TaxID=66370 RepID=A0A917RCW4_9ACTN|nr:ABC transporter ATP-binding protein [Streptomyces flaveus]GGL02180.1 ABC transporter ATP-binding protein [Streptomyces flaveus]
MRLGAPRRHEPGPSTHRFLREVVRHSAGRCTALCLISVATATAELVMPFLLGHAVDALLTDRPAPWAGHWTVLAAALTGTLIVAQAGEALLTGTTAARTAAWTRGRLLRHILAVGPPAQDHFSPGDLASRVVGNASHTGAAPAAVAGLLAAGVTPLGALLVLTLLDPWLGAAFILGIPLLVLLLRAFVRDTSDSVSRYQRVQGEMAGRLLETLRGARTVAAAGTTRRERSRILRPLPELGRHGHRTWQVLGRSTARAAAILPLLQLLVLAVGGLLLTAHRLTVGELLAASRYAALATGIGMLVSRVNDVVRSRAAADRVDEVLAEPATAHGTRRLPAGAGTLEFRGVAVVRGGRTVLRAVDVSVPAGSSLAVVGRSGTGKSVFAALAGRLADPDEGVVLLDGVPLPELCRDELRRAVGYAFARPALFGGTVGSAIAVGPTTVPRQTVVSAARQACADDFVRLLPDGYETACRATALSGGEVQRLGLARAFAHSGRLLVLDDATSSLDTVTERRIGAALWQGLDGRTRVVVAHRASTAARADLVAWLDGGQVRAVAPHAALWCLPEYRAVFEPQCTEDDRPAPAPLLDQGGGGPGG